MERNPQITNIVYKYDVGKYYQKKYSGNAEVGLRISFYNHNKSFKQIFPKKTLSVIYGSWKRF